MKTRIIYYCVFAAISFLLPQKVFSQVLPEAGDPQVNADVSDFYKTRLSDIYAELNTVKNGEVKAIAISPGGHPVYAVYYGEKEDLRSQANYNSAVAARNAAFYARKTKDTKPVMLFVGPVHGQEVEGIAGMVNLIRVAETGRDLRGKEWPLLKKGIDSAG